MPNRIVAIFTILLLSCLLSVKLLDMMSHTFFGNNFRGLKTTTKRMLRSLITFRFCCHYTAKS